MPSILLFGVTGLVGSHLVLALKKTYPDFPVTVYLRNTTIDEYLTSTAGVSKIVHGTFNETEKLSALAKDHDIVINVGNSWDPVLSEAIVAGLKLRPEGVQTTLIHMSGGGNFVDTTNSSGITNPKAKVWNDNDVDDMKLLNPKMLNGQPDKVVLDAGKGGKIGTYILFPTGLYGASTGPVKALGIIQLLMHQKAKELGFIPYFGDGTAIFSTLHVLDTIPPLLAMIDLSLKQPTPKGSVYERCYIIAANADPWLAVSTKFAEVFHAKGVIDSPVPRRIRPEEAGGGEIPMLMARDIFVKCQRAEKELNFRPVQETLSGNLAKTFDEYSL